MANQNNIKKEITIADFIKKYDKLTSDKLKIDMVESLIYRTYVPILEKKLVLQTIFDKCLMGDLGNQYIDMFMNKIQVTISILQLYTNLTFVKKGVTSEGKEVNQLVDHTGNNLFDDYDMLAERDLLNMIFGFIPESELNSIMTINKEISETFYNQTKSPAAYVGAMIDRFGNVVGSMADSSSKALLALLQEPGKLEALMETMSKSEITNKVVDMASKLNFK